MIYICGGRRGRRARKEDSCGGKRRNRSERIFNNFESFAPIYLL